MNKVLVLGCGLVGKTIAEDLAIDFDVTVVDTNQENLDKINKTNTIKCICGDVFSDSIEKEIDKNNIVVGALPGSCGYVAAEQVLLHGVNYVDISFAPEDLREDLQDLAEEKNCTCLIDFGVAPGLSNLIFGYYYSILKKMHKYEIFVGGLPQNPAPPWYYKAPFSPNDVIEEYIRPARFIKNGEIVTKPALSDIKPESTWLYSDKLMALESFLTDGVRTLLDYTDVDTIIEKTIRYSGYAEKIKILRDTGLLNQPHKKTVSKLLVDAWEMTEEDKDFTIMRLNIVGEDIFGHPVNETYTLFDEYDEQTNTSSMARTTGYMCTAGVRLINKNDLDIGMFTPEGIGHNPYFVQFIIDELEKRNVILKSC